eukprot:scaffold1420_cov153-Isochrysis_galbana.AAC.2
MCGRPAVRAGGCATSHNWGHAPSNARSCASAARPESEPATRASPVCEHTVNTPVDTTEPLEAGPPPVR